MLLKLPKLLDSSRKTEIKIIVSSEIHIQAKLVKLSKFAISNFMNVHTAYLNKMYLP